MTGTDVEGSMIEGLHPIAGSYRPAASSQPLLVDHIAQLCAGAFAEFCAIYLRGATAPVAFFTRTPGQYASLREAPFDDLFLERARDAGLGRVLHQPLLIDGNPAGYVVLGTNGSNTATEVNPTICDAVATIISSALAQASLLDHHHRVSERLQRAMLPSRLVEADGITFDAAYRPASHDAEVGGDWYDVFEIGNGTIGISIGDVTGHGLEAAVTMSEIRGAIRAAAATQTSPAALLNAVEAMVSTQGSGIASAIVGIYDPVTHVLRYASAGHPSPVLVTSNGLAYFLTGGGVLLGLGTPAASDEHVITLAPGSTFFMYTDGLTEQGRDLASGEECLISTLQALSASDDLAPHRVHAEIIGEGPSIDDCATLMLQRHQSTAAPLERYTFSALPNFARLARDATRSYAERAGFARERVFDVIVAVGEAVANAIEHGSRADGALFVLELSTVDDEMVVRVESSGHWRSTPSQGERGRGVQIMRACASRVQLASTVDRTRLMLTFARL
jgi:anti-sigma regulatory factor (Ser/Thr protein kinase)